MDQLPARVARISDHLYRVHGVQITPDSPDDVLDQLPALVANLGRLRNMTEAEFASALAGARPNSVDALRAVLPRTMLDGETLAMVFDAALLMGEAFRRRYPDAQWAIGAKPKTSVDYCDPVLIGVDPFKSEFGVRRLMTGAVGMILHNKEDEWPLSRIMSMNAYQLGLGPDRSPEGMSDFEKMARG